MTDAQRWTWWSILLFLSLGFQACQTTASKPGENGDTTSPRVASYRLGPNDSVRVQVFGEEALTTETQVRGDGKVTLPLIGTIHLEGLTLKESEDLIAARLAEGFLKAPRVSIYIVRHRNFFVSGEVRSPGGFPYIDGLTVLKAVTMAGGFTDKAAQGRIKIKRMKGGEEETLSVGLAEPVRPDDIIVVPQSFF